jgi:hypothetical protein
MAAMSRIGYWPTDRVLAVVDDAATADRVVDALVAAGWDPTTIERLTASDAGEALDPTGRTRGLVGRLSRLIEFGLVDQLPDLAWYEAAALEGRTVLAVPARGARSGVTAGRIVAAAGGHFVNRFGRFETEELVRWRGPEPPVGDLLKR